MKTVDNYLFFCYNFHFRNIDSIWFWPLIDTVSYRIACGLNLTEKILYELFREKFCENKKVSCELDELVVFLMNYLECF